jgi:hypothetical protein
VFSVDNQYDIPLSIETEEHTVYCALVWAVVAEPLARPVAPVAALNSTRTRKVPTVLSRSCIYVHAH